MKITTYLLSAAATVLILTGCQSKMKEFKAEYFNTNPSPLEVVGSSVPATISGNVPAKFVPKNAKVTITPLLAFNGQEVKGIPVMVQGEEARANGQVVSYSRGGGFTVPFSVAYLPDMNRSELFLDFNVDQNGKIYALPRLKVADGVLATATFADPATVAPAVAQDGFQKVIEQKYNADIHFLINQANIRANQTDTEGYIDLNKKLVEANKSDSLKIAGVKIHSYASPEGSLEFNTQLAEKREKNTTELMQNQLKKDNITEFGELTSQFTPEDWEGFRDLVAKSNIQDKELILSVLSMYKEPEQREKEIRNMASVFNELAEQILPQLRYSRIQATINVIGKSDDELARIFSTNPAALSADEILYLATLTDDNAKKMQVYQKAVELFPNDYRAHNNLGLAKYIARDYDGATAEFDKALALNPSSREAAMNKGLIAMLNHDYSDANVRLGASAGIPESAEALGVYYLTQGDTRAALQAFGDSKSNNAALANILNKNYSEARNILTQVPNPDATTYYLMAVIGARTNNESMVLSNLRQAARMDNSILQRAKQDMEFDGFNLNLI